MGGYKTSLGDQQKLTVLFDNEQTKVNLKFIKKETISTYVGSK